MNPKTALYNLDGNFVMSGKLDETFDYLKNVIGVGHILRVAGLSEKEITTLKFEQASMLVKNRKGLK
jgi:hypothetical protein